MPQFYDFLTLYNYDPLGNVLLYSHAVIIIPHFVISLEENYYGGDFDQ